MTKFKSPSILNSILNALNGLKLAFFSQRNFVIEVIVSIVVFTFSFILKFSITDLCLLIIIITIVLLCELINTVIEFTLDALFKNNYSKLVGMAKDISAGMVLLAGIFCFISGIILFCKYL